MKNITKDKSSILFIVLGGFFICNALLAEFIGIKIFSLEKTFGLSPVDFNLFGNVLSFQLTAGVVMWPVVFVLTDLINEYYGPKGVRFLSNGAIMLIIYSFIMVFIAIQLIPADWWVGSKKELGIPDMQIAFESIFGQGLWIIIGSLTAFLVGQIIDVYVFRWLKLKTGEKFIWLRATGSTLVSQLIDSFVVLYIAFGIGANWEMDLIIAIGLMNYCYKFAVAIALTPVLYWVHMGIDNYLGESLATQMKKDALL